MANHVRFLLCLCLAIALCQGGAAWGASLAPIPGPASRSAVAPASHPPDVSTLDVPDDEVGGSLDRQFASAAAVVDLPGVDLQPPRHAPLTGLTPSVGCRAISRYILYQVRLI